MLVIRYVELNDANNTKYIIIRVIYIINYIIVIIVTNI